MSFFSRIIRSCVWLWALPMGISLALWGRLGPVYQRDVFWQDIPPLLGVTENTFRYAAIATSAAMVIGTKTRREKIGAVLYLIGMALYIASYVALIVAPSGPWSSSFAGFAAPAYTPVIWILGIALIGQKSVFLKQTWKDLTFLLSSAGFLISHISHTALVYARVF